MREVALLEKPAECCAPLASKDLSDGEAETAATLFKALSDPNRVRIVNLLATSDEAVCVCNITPLLEVSQPTVSFHLRKLVDAGLLDREQRGVWAYYSLNGRAAARLAGIFQFEGGTR
jgi:ArsR family transcriptional regulator